MSDVLDGFLGGVGKGLIDAGNYVIKDSFEQKAYARREAIQQKMWEERNAVTHKQNQELSDTKYTRDLALDEIKNNRAVEAAQKKEEGLDRRNTADNRTKMSVQELKNAGGVAAAPAQVVSSIKEMDEKMKLLTSKLKAIREGEIEGNSATIEKQIQAAQKIKTGYSRALEYYKRGDVDSGGREVGDIQQWLYEENQRLKKIRASQEK